ncbi:MAG TPA: c-type cytochrome [Bacteroidota bacterium]|nr:c-type cytochrome [Bacteroidota bacterium]
MKNLPAVIFSAIGLVVFMTGICSGRQNPSDSTLLRGRILYEKNCSGCHGDKGQGFAGPNLTDKFWIHGGGPKNITASISEGVPGKGMITWKDILSPAEIQMVMKYVRSLQGTNPPKAKAAEGELTRD